MRGATALPSPVKLRMPEWLNPGSETARDKLRSQKDKNPDHQLRSPTSI